jgi:hypothetical protein
VTIATQETTPAIYWIPEIIDTFGIFGIFAAERATVSLSAAALRAGSA